MNNEPIVMIHLQYHATPEHCAADGCASDYHIHPIWYRHRSQHEREQKERSEIAAALGEKA